MDSGREQLNDNRNGRASGSLMAIILIVVGVLFFIDNLGLIDIPNIGQLWPLGVLAYGAAMLVRSCNASGRIWGAAMVAWGGLVTLGNFGYLRTNAGNVWPIFLIAAGFSLLIRRGPRSRVERRRRAMEFGERLGHRYGSVEFAERVSAGATAGARWSAGEEYLRNPARINDQAVFASITRRHEAAVEGGQIDAIFGSVDLDLSRATIQAPAQEITIETNAVFGGIRVRIPETWKVNFKGSAVLGGFEDKTITVRLAPGETAATLVVTGSAVFGGVEFYN